MRKITKIWDGRPDYSTELLHTRWPHYFTRFTVFSKSRKRLRFVKNWWLEFGCFLLLVCSLLPGLATLSQTYTSTREKNILVSLTMTNFETLKLTGLCNKSINNTETGQHKILNINSRASQFTNKIRIIMGKIIFQEIS